jgi:hypothetical protein
MTAFCHHFAFIAICSFDVFESVVSYPDFGGKSIDLAAVGIENFR